MLQTDYTCFSGENDGQSRLKVLRVFLDLRFHKTKNPLSPLASEDGEHFLGVREYPAVTSVRLCSCSCAYVCVYVVCVRL